MPPLDCNTQTGVRPSVNCELCTVAVEQRVIYIGQKTTLLLIARSKVRLMPKRKATFTRGIIGGKDRSRRQRL
jgi:hypothetical protein